MSLFLYSSKYIRPTLVDADSIYGKMQTAAFPDKACRGVCPIYTEVVLDLRDAVEDGDMSFENAFEVARALPSTGCIRSVLGISGEAIVEKCYADVPDIL